MTYFCLVSVAELPILKHTSDKEQEELPLMMYSVTERRAQLHRVLIDHGLVITVSMERMLEYHVHKFLKLIWKIECKYCRH